MEQDNLHSPVAITYAKALLELAAEQTDWAALPEIIGHELMALRKIITDEPLVGALFSDPAIGHVERSALLDRVFKDRVSPLLLKFLQILNEKGRLNLIASMAGAYGVLLDKRQGKVEVDVTLAQRLDAQQLEQVRQRIAAALNREVVIHQYVDASIIGGLILRVQDKLIDGSVRTQLSALREKILGARPA
jgi:F-type H+-transporting ATPase subunit delta